METKQKHIVTAPLRFFIDIMTVTHTTASNILLTQEEMNDLNRLIDHLKEITPTEWAKRTADEVRQEEMSVTYDFEIDTLLAITACFCMHSLLDALDDMEVTHDELHEIIKDYSEEDA